MPGPEQTPHKVELGLDKRCWKPSPLPGLIVLVSSVDADGNPNVAPKSWISMVAFSGPILGFGCNYQHQTYRNVMDTGVFVINVPSERLADQVFNLPQRQGRDRLRASGLSLGSARAVNAPIVTDCRAHFECELDDVKRYGDEVFIFGRIVAASIDEECLEGTQAEQYFNLRPMFFLEDQTCGTIDTAKRIGEAMPTDQIFFHVEVGEPEVTSKRLQEEHVRFLRNISLENRLFASGSFTDASDRRLGGSYILATESLVQAERVAKSDPLVCAGASMVVRVWRRTF